MIPSLSFNDTVTKISPHWLCPVFFFFFFLNPEACLGCPCFSPLALALSFTHTCQLLGTSIKPRVSLISISPFSQALLEKVGEGKEYCEQNIFIWLGKNASLLKTSLRFNANITLPRISSYCKHVYFTQLVSTVLLPYFQSQTSSLTLANLSRLLTAYIQVQNIV